MSDEAVTRYARTAGGQVAYQVIGDGPIDVLVNCPTVFPIDLMWDEPRLVHFLNRLSSFCRHIWFDPRGTGASDSIPRAEGRLVESVADDIVAVLDDVGCERVALVELGVPIGLLFAATHPDRTNALVLINATARLRRAEDYPEGLAEQQIEEMLGGELFPQAGLLAPSLVEDARFVRWLDRATRLTCPPEDRVWRQRLTYEIDVRDALSAIRVPTLVLSRRERRIAAQTRYLADHIDGARYVEFPGTDVLPFAGDARPILDAVEEFLTGKLASPELDRVLATILFTDLVESTAREVEIGDQQWRELLATHDAVVRDEVERFRGRTVKFTGDGVLATFDGPARGIRCAAAIRDRIQALGLEMRAGLHAGEIDVLDDDISGIAVNIAERVASGALAGEVRVSRTVADLLAGSNIQFGDVGEHQLKGVPGTRRLFSVLDEPLTHG